MTARSDFDLALRDWFETTAHTVEPADLQETAIRRARTARQRPRWLASPLGGYPAVRSRTTFRPAYLLAVLAALVGAALVWSVLPVGFQPQVEDGPSPTASAPTNPSPSQESPSASAAQPDASDPSDPSADGRATSFLAPFDYVIPDGIRLVPVGGDGHQHVIRWTVDNLHGVTVAAGQEAWAHGSSSRFSMSGAPANVIERLRDQGGLDLGPVRPLELDGMPALAATVDDSDATDIHVGQESLPYHNYLQLNVPSLLIVSSVEGNVVFITIWARSAEARDAFTTTAMKFVDSIHFVDAP